MVQTEIKFKNILIFHEFEIQFYEAQAIIQPYNLQN